MDGCFCFSSFVFWTATVYDELVGPFQGQSGEKMNSEEHCTILKTKKVCSNKSCSCRNDVIFKK